MGLKSGSIIKTGEYLKVNDYIASPSDLFFAIQQGDGNFCVYRGTGPADNQGFMWASMVTDPISDFQISHIDYDVANAQILESGPAELTSETVTNQTTVSQTSTVAGSETVTETSGWSNSLAISVGVKSTFECSIPFVGGAKIEVSAQVTDTYTWNGSNSRSKTWSWSTPVTVPPGGVTTAIIAATVSTIAVPYTLSGTAVFKSGVKMPAQLKGVYTGTNSHNVTVKFVSLGPSTGELTVSTKAL